MAARATTTLNESLEKLRPAIVSAVEHLKSVAADSMTVEFGLKVGGEAGLILAKGTAEVNFRVELSWNRGSR